MTRVIHRLCLAVLVLGAVMAGTTATHAAAPKAKTESYSALLKQVSRGEVRTAVLVPKRKSLHARLRRGTRYTVRYPARDDRRLVKLLHAKRVHVAFTQPRKHHHRRIRRRYVALAGIGVLALGGFAVWYFTRRNRRPGARPRPSAARS